MLPGADRPSAPPHTLARAWRLCLCGQRGFRAAHQILTATPPSALAIESVTSPCPGLSAGRVWVQRSHPSEMSSRLLIRFFRTGAQITRGYVSSHSHLRTPCSTRVFWAVWQKPMCRHRLRAAAVLRTFILPCAPRPKALLRRLSDARVVGQESAAQGFANRRA